MPLRSHAGPVPPISPADHVAPDPLPAVPGAPPGGRSGTPWAVAVLLLGTLLLVGYLAVLWVAAALAVSFGAAVGLFDESLSPDVASLVLDVVPGVLTGWVAGLLANRVLASGTALGPRPAGATGGLLGCALGAVVLHAQGIL